MGQVLSTLPFFPWHSWLGSWLFSTPRETPERIGCVYCSSTYPLLPLFTRRSSSTQKPELKFWNNPDQSENQWKESHETSYPSRMLPIFRHYNFCLKSFCSFTVYFSMCLQSCSDSYPFAFFFISLSSFLIILLRLFCVILEGVVSLGPNVVGPSPGEMQHLFPDPIWQFLSSFQKGIRLEISPF